jgi:apolipoprotein N-acyltransferase
VTEPARRPRAALPLLAGLLLAASTPPAWFPGAEWLVLVGLAAWYAVATDARRPLWHAYVLGCVHMALFSWSVRHVLLLAFGFIVVVGGVYYLLATAATRAARGALRPLAFAAAVAGSFWLRANAPEIWYPHGQPCHSLWQWPSWMHAVVVGGEGLANALLALLAASACELARSWRVADPPWSRARNGFLLAAVLFVAVPALGHALRTRAPAGEPPVAVALIEPGFHLQRELDPLSTDEQRRARYDELLERRLLAPTRELVAAPPPPDVLLWPESSVYVRHPPDPAQVRAGDAQFLAGRWPRSPSLVLFGTNVEGDGGLPTPAAVLVELPSGRTLAHQEKRCLVPGGEFQPFVGLLPRFAIDALREWFRQVFGSMPEAAAGRELPPLRTRAGVPFGALMCYDNAFPGPARAQVDQGARWLAVLSNETWYEGGAELVQLQAMTVVRALETGTPIVRCTMDGWSGLVGADGRVLASLDLAPAPQPRARILRVDVEPGPGRTPPLAWLRWGSGPAMALALGALLAHAFARWARLARARSTPRPASA